MKLKEWHRTVLLLLLLVLAIGFLVWSGQAAEDNFTQNL
jgi:hypothetical protein